MSSDLQTRLTKFISTWTQKYRFLVKPVPSPAQKENQAVPEAQQTFVAEFSEPSPAQPIADASLKLFFFVPAAGDVQDVAFRVEHDALLHRVNATIKYEEMESFVDMHLAHRRQVRQAYFLATAFERTRLDDPRIGLLPRPLEVVQFLTEQFAVRDPGLFASPRTVPRIHRARVQASNLRLLLELDARVAGLFGFGETRFASLASAMRFLGLFGLAPETRSFWREQLGVVPPTGEGFADWAALQPLLRELLFAKVVFESVLGGARAALRRARLRAVELLKKRFFIIFDEVQQILQNIVMNNNANLNSVRQLLRGLGEKFLSAAETAAVEARFRDGAVTPEQIQGLKQAILEVKAAGFLPAYLLVAEPPVHRRLCEALAARGLARLAKDDFLDFLRDNGAVAFVPRQAEFFWAFLDSRGCLEDGELRVDQGFLVVTRFVTATVELQPLLGEFLAAPALAAPSQVVFPDRGLQEAVLKVLGAPTPAALQGVLAEQVSLVASALGDPKAEFAELRAVAGSALPLEAAGVVRALSLDRALGTVLAHFLAA